MHGWIFLLFSLPRPCIPLSVCFLCQLFQHYVCILIFLHRFLLVFIFPPIPFELLTFTACYCLLWCTVWKPTVVLFCFKILFMHITWVAPCFNLCLLFNCDKCLIIIKIDFISSNAVVFVLIHFPFFLLLFSH